MVKVYSITYNGKEHLAAEVPDVIAGSEYRLLIGSQSLNIALYDEEKGYQDYTAKAIDEQIYAYVEDEYFLLEEFAGKGRTTIAYIPERQEPELMYKLFSTVCCSIDELIEALK